VERAKAGAARSLQGAECAKVLAEFADGEGRTLDRSLEGWDMSAAEYALTLPFRDGRGMSHCDHARVALVTIRGFRRVYVCPRRVGAVHSLFAETGMQNRPLTEAMVIPSRD
jgi:hypothetical protein